MDGYRILTNGLLMQFILRETIREKTIVFPVSFSNTKYIVSDATYGIRTHLRVGEKNTSSIKLSCYDTINISTATSPFDLFFIGS